MKIVLNSKVLTSQSEHCFCRRVSAVVARLALRIFTVQSTRAAAHEPTKRSGNIFFLIFFQRGLNLHGRKPHSPNLCCCAGIIFTLFSETFSFMKQSAKKPKNTSPAALPGQPVSTPVQSASGLQELFLDGLKDMYWAENHLVKSLPKMVSAAGDATLKTGLETHLQQTEEHAERLEGIFESMGVKTEAKKCDAMEGLVMSGEHVIENTVAGTDARDTGIIMSALKVESFEIAAYNGLIQLATVLGYTNAAEALNQNLSDEVETKEQLTALSQKTASALMGTK